MFRSHPTFCSLNAALNTAAAARNAVFCSFLPGGHVIWPTYFSRDFMNGLLGNPCIYIAGMSEACGPFFKHITASTSPLVLRSIA
jgi:hypothetical protein